MGITLKFFQLFWMFKYSQKNVWGNIPISAVRLVVDYKHLKAEHAKKAVFFFIK